MKNLCGIIIPAVTPFDWDGTLRLDMLKNNYRLWNKTAVQGCMALGSNGEFRSLSDDEAFEVIRSASETIADDKTFIAGISRESLYQTIQFLKRIEAADLKIDYISVLTPHYFKKLMTDEALIRYYTAIADVSRYPVLLYCAPGFANGVCFSADALKVLADHPNIAGIKDTSKNMMNEYMNAVGGRDDFEVLSGSLETIMTCLERGGKGGIVSAANYFPNACGHFYQLVMQEGLAAAKPYYERLKKISAETGGRAGVAGVKAAMNLMGYQGGIPRIPVLPCNGEIVNEISGEIDRNQEFVKEDYILEK